MSLNFKELIPILGMVPCLLVGATVEGPAAILSTIAVEVATIQFGVAWSNLRKRWVPDTFLHEEIQNALTKSFLEAFKKLEDDFFLTIGR